MAPTICLSELPVVRRPTIPCSRRRQRVSSTGAIGKHQRLELRRTGTNPVTRGESRLTPPESSIWEPECSNDSYTPTIVSSSSPKVSARVPADAEEHWKVFLARRKGLLDIVVRTMALVRRNHILQERVNALSAETRDFIHSVLNNPENKCAQQRLDAQNSTNENISSTTEKTNSRPSSLPSSPDSTYASFDDVTSSCSSSERDEQSSDEFLSSETDEL
ncbi:uncharacterized protein LOC117222838 isoform X2 [Megalopta genalis]|nr:uncharacterized protein LOC117222838 isoform X2 [Megalopta genalis]XP_033330696.1 uncharacterized protein LOC117222838 isoform X2 [Megalopta genalis]XP_033330697.1 uncharacterized protein LOC117222838 isoform X2 [Megalopta genalis]XP_033330698.1 uncharacterized protein LOC117222838 isoform X2 [Megalopta genalis]XP_033330699.1 uncharacterized protein LOC117222838 isoform X2 [Megalopta genalis]XP_033330700.1 uncharacterized protein LOC117222838 isoform X2 [Megalopta genalis]